MTTFKIFSKTSLTILLAALMGVVAPARAQEETNRVVILPQPLTADDEVEPFSVSAAFKVILAAYKEEIQSIRNSDMSAEKKAQHTDRLMARVAELTLLHDRIVDIAPVGWAVAIYIFGLELPIPVSRKLFKLGMVSVNGAIGGVFTAKRNRGTGQFSALSIGGTSIIGPGLTFGSRAGLERRSGASGVKIFAGAAVLLPLDETVPAMRLGDLQGWYYGGAGEISFDLGNQKNTPVTVQGGLYVKPNGVRYPQAGMAFGYVGLGSQDTPFNLQVEALNFGILVDSEGSSFRSPIPFSHSSRTSPHAYRNRMEEMRARLPKPVEIEETVRRVQDSLLREEQRKR